MNYLNSLLKQMGGNNIKRDKKTRHWLTDAERRIATASLFPGFELCVASFPKSTVLAALDDGNVLWVLASRKPFLPLNI